MPHMRFGVSMIEKIQMVCWDISGSLTSGYQLFRGTHTASTFMANIDGMLLRNVGTDYQGTR